MHMIIKFVLDVDLVAHVGIHNSKDIHKRACKPVSLFAIGKRRNIKDHVLNIPAIFRNLHGAAGGVVFHNVYALLKWIAGLGD